MSTDSFARNRRAAVWEIEDLRDLHKPTTFDEWVCLGGDYLNQAEVQEWASKEESQELSAAFSAFQKKLEYNGMVEKADEAQARQWFRSEPQEEAVDEDGKEDECDE